MSYCMPKASNSNRKSSEIRIGVILGTGLYKLFESRVVEKLKVDTSFGTAELSRISNRDGNAKATVYLLLRHGETHSIPPHLINYRANMTAFSMHKVDFIIATSSVGAIDPRIPVGSYLVIDQFIDQTTRRPATMFANVGERFAHTDMTVPYSVRVRKAIIASLKKNKIGNVITRGTYVCTEGPRFETPAEISMYRKLGGDAVGMTGIPEVVLANELGIPYATLCFVTNKAAGLQSKISNEEVILQMKKHEGRIKTIIDDAIEQLILSS